MSGKRGDDENMATAESPWADTFDAASVINAAVEESDSSAALLQTLDRKKEGLEAEERALVQRYIVGIRPKIKDVLVKDLGETVGGQWDGSEVTMGKSVLYVYAGVERTIDNAEETWKHENYHAEHDHTAEMIAGSSAAGETVVAIGGREFTDEALIEGITVAQTGHEFVSDEYRRFENDVHVAIAAAGIHISDVEEAIDAKDLTRIDDEDRKQRETVQ